MRTHIIILLCICITIQAFCIIMLNSRSFKTIKTFKKENTELKKELLDLTGKHYDLQMKHDTFFQLYCANWKKSCQNHDNLVKVVDCLAKLYIKDKEK